MCQLALTFVAAAFAASPTLPNSLDLDTIRALPLQHDGRWPPLDTVARDLVENITGDAFYQGHDPVLWLLAWSFDGSAWRKQPLITIKNAELRRELQLSPTKTVFSHAELAGHRRLRSLIDDLARVEEGRKLNPLESKVADINEKLTRLSRMFTGTAIRIIPDPDDVVGTWKPIMGNIKDASESVRTVSAAWSALREAFLADDAKAFAAASDGLVTAAGALPAAHRPADELIATEIHYNELRPFRSAWMVMLAGALLAATAMIARRKWFDAIAVVGLIAGFATLTYGLSLRWQIAGRIPASNMFESLLFLSWGMGAFAIVAVFALPHRIVPLTASAMGALALVLADCLPLDHYVRPIPPVLRDTIWMSIHVPVIMVSYSVLALGVLFAHVQLAVMAVAPRRRRFADLIDSLHYWYIHVGSILLLAGIITGSMWAASSWGRYWGWDPKEVWSLVAFLGYLAILHVRVDRDRVPRGGYAIGALLAIALFAMVIHRLGPLTGAKSLAFAGTASAMLLFVLTRGPFATALKSIICFWLIIMTYVGVNYILGIGLHSYGFGTGAMARYMLMIGGIDLSFAALLTLIYIFRRPSQAPRAVETPAVARA